MTEPSQYFKGRTVQEQMNEVIGYVDTRAAEVATDAIAADVAQVHQDMLDADAYASAAAASAAAAAGTLANAVKKTGEASQSIAGDIAVAGDLSAGGDLAVTGDVTGGTVTVPTPVNNTDATSKKYVDDQDALLIPIIDINQYAVGLTGNQDPIAGDKTFTGKIVNRRYRDNGYIEIDDSFFNNKVAQNFEIFLNICDGNGVRVGALGIRQNSNSTREMRVLLMNSDNETYKSITIATSD